MEADPGTAGVIMLRCFLLLGLALAIAGEAAANGSIGTPPDEALRAALARIEPILERMDAGELPAEEPGALVPQPATPVRDTAWSALQSALDDQVEYLEPRRLAFRCLVARFFNRFLHPRDGLGAFRTHPSVRSLRFRCRSLGSLLHTQRAFRKLSRTEADFPGSARALGVAVRLQVAAGEQAAPGSADERFARKATNNLTAVTSRLAAQVIGRAAAAGFADDELSEAEQTLSVGTEFLDEGRPVEGVQRVIESIFLTPIPIFSIDVFEQKIRDRYDDESVGYAYAINSVGWLFRAGAGGNARTLPDLPIVAQSALKEINIASVSKTITATALLALLQDLGPSVSVDSSISPYLPNPWSQGPGISNLTFRDLLTHNSGLDQNQNGPYADDSLEAYVAQGVAPADKVFEYQNANFAMFRVLIPFLLYGHGFLDALPAPTQAAVLAGLYIDYVQARVLFPSGIGQADCTTTESAPPTLNYRFAPNRLPGFAPLDWTLLCGSGGWYLSAVELAAFMAGQRFDNAILSPAARQVMDNGFLGWADPNQYGAAVGDYGIYRHHGGMLLWNPQPYRGLETCIMNFPSTLQVAFVVNSVGGNTGFACSSMRFLYDSSFGP